MTSANGDDARTSFERAVPDQIELTSGEQRRLSLLSAAGAGFIWTSSFEAGDLGAARIEIETGPMPPLADEPTSALAPVALVASGLRAGGATWRVRLARPWQPERPMVDRLVRVQVR